MEARGQYLHEISSTIHYGICCDNHYYESSGDLPTQCNNDEYHVYTLDWTPTKLVRIALRKFLTSINIYSSLVSLCNKEGYEEVAHLQEA